MRTLLIALACFVMPSAVDAADVSVANGKELVEANCKMCHALGAEGASPLSEAPPFRDIPKRYDPGELEDAFNDGVPTEHPAMPDWAMTPEQAHDIAAYIMSLAEGQ